MRCHLQPREVFRKGPSAQSSRVTRVHLEAYVRKDADLSKAAGGSSPTSKAGPGDLVLYSFVGRGTRPQKQHAGAAAHRLDVPPPLRLLLTDPATSAHGTAILIRTIREESSGILLQA